MTDRSAPDCKLQLEWVYGYRGHQCRNNLFYTASKEIVYFVAGVGVVCSHGDEKRQRFFLGHSDDIISLALHPDQSLVATGQVGKEPFICVWDSASLDTVSILQGGHERGVAAVGFSGDGKLLASVGLDDYHTLNVWDWRKGRILSSTRGHNDRIFDVQFNPFLPSTLVTCGVKHIKFWTLSGNSLTGRKGIFGRVGELQSILCAVFASEEVCYSGTLSGDVYKWSGHTLQSVIKRAHMGAIYSMYSCEDGFATGSKDSVVKLWDKQFKIVTQLDLANSSTGYKGLVVRSVCWAGTRVLVGTKDSEVYEVSVEDRTHPLLIVGGHSEGELWALATHPSNQVFATGSDDKTVRIWRMGDRSMVARSSTPQAVRSLAYSPDGEHLAAGMQDGSFIVLDAHNLSQLALIKKRKEVLHEMKYSPDGQYLAVGSNDNFVDIYSVAGGYKHVGKCSGSSSFITHLDWSVDSQYLQTNSGASERLYYQMPGGNRVTAKAEVQAIHWSSWTGVLGTEVNGIWPKYSQVNDVNASHASFDHQVIVTGDDFGLVKLFRFPSIKKGAKFRKYIGHSAHVTNVRFTHSQSHVISVGGADNAIFQWAFIPPGGGVADEDDDESTWGAGSEAEGSDSELSDVASLDSDIEREGEITYDRAVAKEDIQLIKMAAKKEAKTSGARKERSGIKASSEGRRSGAPDTSLSLTFVHGYRGYDCRNNLYYTSTGEVVYHVAAVGVVYNKTTHSQRFYTAHTDDILCLSLHPSQDLVATGQVGKDPPIHVWDAVSMETVSVLKGHHARGVCAVAFSSDGKRLASVGLDDHHTIVVWGWRKGEMLATSRGHGDKIFMISWDPSDTDKLVTVGIKHIKFWSQAGGGFVSKRGIYGNKGKATTQLCVEFGTVGGVCFTGGADGRVYHWTGRQLAKTVDAHKGPVYAMQRVEKGFISGGRDGVVALWDEGFENILKTYALHSSAVGGGRGQLYADTPPIRALCLGQGKILVGTKNSEVLEVDRSGPINLLVQGHLEGEVWGLATHPRSDVCVSVSDDGAVRVWDLVEHRVTRVRSLGRSARSVGYSHDGGTIAVGMKDGSCEVLNADTLETVMTVHHRKEEISDVKFSPTGKFLAVASHDNFVDIYSTASRKRVGTCKGASSYITHIDWDESGKLLQVNTGDSEVLYFEAPRGKQQFINKEDAEEIVWASWTCVLGPSVKGVWPPYTDITDVNAACVSHDGHVIATGDDFGYVKLFTYPSYGKHAKCKQYVGHSAHVTNVRWSHDDRSLISLGGADTSLMVWRYSGARAQETDQSDHTVVASGYVSEDSDTDSEEEGGYDSDVDREKNMDYGSKTYAQPTRDPTLIKPHLQPSDRNQGADRRKKGGVSRSANTTPRVSTADKRSKVTDLSLDYIFGYRGFDTRQNVWVSPDGCVVYHAAGAGVVYNPLTQSQSFYLEHTDDIICLSMCRNSKLAHIVATGQIGRGAPVHVWDAHTKQTLSILQGAHGVGVCSVDFSSNGKLLVTVGLDQDHTLTVWRWSDGTKVAQVHGDHHRLFTAQFRPDSNTKFVSCGVKHVRFWTLAGTQLISKRGTVPKSVGGASMQTVLSLAFAPDDVTFTGTVSGDVYVWAGAVMSRVVSKAHSGPVFAMFTSLSDGLVLSAGKEKSEGGGVKLWDVDMNRSQTFTLDPNVGVVRAVFRSKGKILVGTQTSQLLEIEEKSGAVQVLVQGHSEGELWGLAVHPSTHKFVTASDDKTVRTWDLNSKTMLRETNLGVAVRSADFSPDGQRVVVGQSNGEFVVLSVEDLSVVSRKRDRSQMIQVVRYSPDGSLTAVGSNDACVDIYSSADLNRVGYCRGIPSFVTHLDWSHDSKYLQVSTGAYEKLVFQVSNGKHVTDSFVLDRIVWSTWTSVLGEEVVGVWPKSADKGDVNTAHLNSSGTTVATGDDFGCVKLFDGFPLIEKFAPHKKYYGHSAHVTCVRFLHDDSYLLSAGGDDSCVFVWRCGFDQ